MKNDALHRLDAQVVHRTDPHDLQVAEPVKGEAGLPGFHSTALQGVVIRGPGRAQIFRVQAAARLQNLGVAKGQGNAPSAGYAEAHPPRKVLAKVEAPAKRQPTYVRRAGEQGGGKGLLAPDRWPG